MSRLKKLRAAWFVVLADDKRPSRRTIQEACKRNFGSAFHTDEVAEFLRVWQYVGADGLFHLRESLGPVGVQHGSSPGPPSGPVSVLKNEGLGPVEDSEKTSSGPTRADLEEKREENIETIDRSDKSADCPEDAPSENEDETANKRRTRSKPDLSKPHVWPKHDDPSQPAWVIDMRRLINAATKRAISTLNADERFTLAMYHCWRWGNCTIDESRNRRQAKKVASGLANMGFHPKWLALTVGEYIHAGDKIWNDSGRYPNYSAWSTIGALEEAVS